MTTVYKTVLMAAQGLIAVICLVLPAAAQPAADKNPAEAAYARSVSRNSDVIASQGVGPIAPSSVYTGSPSLPPGAVVVEDETAANLDDYDDMPVYTISDPLEPWNRFWFNFNDIFFLHVAKPVYDGWTFITPQFFRTALSNLFYNVLFPTRFANSVLQMRFFEAGVEFSRFMMNMMGSAGMVDLASGKKTIVPVDPSGETFGQTLGRWGVGHGFYLVWPFIGPSSVRDTVGRIADCFTDPIFYLDPWPVSTGTEVVFRFNDMGDIFPTYSDLKSISIDPYIAMREAYVSMREAQVNR